MPTGNAENPPEVLIPRERIDRRIDEMAAEIAAEYPEDEEIVCLGVLKGSVFFMVDLVRRLPMPVAVDFFQTSSYGSSSSPGEVLVKKDVDLSLRDRHVLLIEDIVDTGHTLNTILAMLQLRRPKSLRLCSLLDKPDRREVEVPIDYLGFSIENVFVVGYGLDYAERWRNLPYVGVVKTE
ncbi:MAG: hypoxanthine phosphoribosyltransferase [Acidobacteriota bacterium]|jgi:hypoxanthine phosphoribosyltransferase